MSEHIFLVRASLEATDFMDSIAMIKNRLNEVMGLPPEELPAGYWERALARNIRRRSIRNRLRRRLHL